MKPEYRDVATVLLHPNPWNPNVMSADEYAQALESIRRFGFVDPITVREREGQGYQIIDGENRWRAATDLGLPQVPVIVVDVDDDVAQQLTIVLNELRGRPDVTKLATLVASLAERQPLAELERVLPFRRAQLAAMVETRREEVDWGRLATPQPVAPAGTKERWTERVYRLPASAAAVVDDAIARACEGDPRMEKWQGLEAIAADFLGGN